MLAQKINGLSALMTRSLSVSRAAAVGRRPGMMAWPSAWSVESHIPGLPQNFAQSQRFYNRKKTIKIPPTNVPRFDYSGDVDYALPKVDDESPKFGFENVEELQSADKTIQDIFSVKFADRQNVLAKQMKETLAKIQEHPADLRSLEVNITIDTIRLRNQIHHMKQFRKDKICKVSLIERIQRRNKLLRILRSRDMEKFEWLLEELKMRYIPLRPPYQNRKLSKRATRKEIARNAFFSVKKEKLEKLREKIEAERKEFEIEKDQELSRLQKELQELGIHEMDSVESVVKELGMEKCLEPQELRMKRRYLILGKKFELWEQNQKKEKIET